MPSAGEIQDGMMLWKKVELEAAQEIEFMLFWPEIDIGKRTESHETYYSYCNTVNNHIIPALGNKRMADVTRGDIQKLFNAKASYLRSVAEQVKNNHECLFSLCGNEQSDFCSSSGGSRIA